MSRETRFIGADGQPLDYSPYGTLGVHSAGSSAGHELAGYPPADVMESGYPPATGSYDPAYGAYVPQMEYHNYQDYPLNTSTPPSVTSGESPPPIRRGSQPAGPPMLPSGYDELDATLQYAQFADNPYGSFVPLQPQVAYNPYEAAPPQGYLDSRPTYDDRHSLYGQRGPPMFATTSGSALVDGAAAATAASGFRDPELHEVISFLSHPDVTIKANAAAYLQHLCFMVSMA